MAAPAGNNNKTKNKPWADALRRALARYADDDVPQGEALNAIASQYVKCAINGDKDAVTEIANRLDGKPSQSIGMDEDSGPIVVQVIRKYVDPGS